MRHTMKRGVSLQWGPYHFNGVEMQGRRGDDVGLKATRVRGWRRAVRCGQHAATDDDRRPWKLEGVLETGSKALQGRGLLGSLTRELPCRSATVGGVRLSGRRAVTAGRFWRDPAAGQGDFARDALAEFGSFWWGATFHQRFKVQQSCVGSWTRSGSGGWRWSESERRSASRRSWSAPPAPPALFFEAVKQDKCQDTCA
jgi:hypothetical protein